MKNANITDTIGLTPEEAFRQMGISRALGYKLIKAGIIPAVKMGERRLIVPRAALEKLLEVPEQGQAVGQ